jgi:PAS domain S-box-containing protein
MRYLMAPKPTPGDPGSTPAQGSAGEQTEPSDALAQLRRAQDTLRDSEQRFRGLLESAPDAMVLTDAAGRIALVNGQVDRLFGYRRDEIIGRPIEVLVPALRSSSTPGAPAATVAVPGTGSLQLEARRKDGTTFPADITLSPLDTKEGVLMMAAVRDATERKRAEAALEEAHRELELRVAERTRELTEALERLQTEVAERRKAEHERERMLAHAQAARLDAEAANRVKDEFVATLSHELRTPLNAIVGWSHLLKLGELDDEMTERAVEAIHRNAMAQTQLVSDILDVSRIITGRLRLAVRPAELLPALEAALASVAAAAAARKIELSTDIDEGCGWVMGDPDRLQQVFWNLLSNAIKFTPAGGRVEVGVRRVAHECEVVVRDDGAGIRAEFLPHVFDRFRQADSSSTRVHGGLGLGLAIVRHLIELHGGSVQAHSDGPGAGAAFTLRLPALEQGAEVPASRPVAAEAAPAEAGGAGPDLRGVYVLVVDDEADARDLLSTILAGQGAEVAVAASADEAVSSIRVRRPDVLLSDIQMPDQDGYALMRRVRALADMRGARIPAAALTAHALPEDRVHALLAGYQAHLPKPAQPAEIIATVASLAGRA